MENGHDIWNLKYQGLYRSGSMTTAASELAKKKLSSQTCPLGCIQREVWQTAGQWLQLNHGMEGR
jgi:hypothetical protein